MIVIDASAAIAALLRFDALGKQARAELTADPEWAAPGVLQAEVLTALAGFARANRKDRLLADAAEDAIAEFGVWVITEVPSAPLIGRVWELRHNVSARDALYVAAAEQLGCALLTADAKLTGATGPSCAYKLIGAQS